MDCVNQEKKKSAIKGKARSATDHLTPIIVHMHLCVCVCVSLVLLCFNRPFTSLGCIYVYHQIRRPPLLWVWKDSMSQSNTTNGGSQKQMGER